MTPTKVGAGYFIGGGIVNCPVPDEGVQNRKPDKP